MIDGVVVNIDDEVDGIDDDVSERLAWHCRHC